jgi:hypothetical protein
MIAKPTTEQILLGCCRELTEEVLPHIDDDTVKVKVLMLDLVLRNAAIRAAHEVAWMEDETAGLRAYAGAVLASAPSTPGVQAALDAGAAIEDDSLHLDDVVERYRWASEAFSCAMEAAMASGDKELIRQAEDVLATRARTETEVMAGWSPVGR